MDDTYTERYAGECFTYFLRKKKKGTAFAFDNFHGANTSPLANFKLSLNAKLRKKDTVESHDPESSNNLCSMGIKTL